MRNRGAQLRRSPSKSKWVKVLCTALLFLAILMLSAVGGYVNRARGGGVHPDGGYWFQHFFSRFLFSLPTAAIVGICSGNWRTFVLVAVMTSCSMVIGWGCYFDVTFQQNGWTSRSGVFDWLLGREEEGWPQVKVFFHNFAGMALRGLTWTAPQGYILYHMGYGWQFAVTGCLMSTPYAFGWSLQSYSWMASGQPWSETIWGYWIWVVSITMAIAGLLERLRENYSRAGPAQRTPNYLSPYITNRWLAVLFEIWHVLLTLIFLCSTVFYSVVQQKDTRNKAQTFFGMFVVTTVQLGAQAVIFTAVWLAKRKDIDLTYELRGVAILCQSPLILRNKVHFSAHRFASRRGSTDEGRPFLTYQQSSGSVNQRELEFESDSAPTSGDQRHVRRQSSQDVLSRSVSDSDESDDIDWSIALSEPSSSVRAWFRKLPYVVWHFADNTIYTLFPALFLLVQGILALIGCGVVTYVTISAVLWNLEGPRYLTVCTCSQ